MTSTLYLFRHGQAAPPGILAGQTDFLLSPEGEAQARYWQTELASVPFSAAWSSPLARARQTAATILRNRAFGSPEVTSVPDLREISLGRWEGKDKDWIIRYFPQEWEQRGADMANIPPPGGESFTVLAARVLPAFQSLCREAAHHTASLLVAHQAVNRVILAHLAGLPLTKILAIAQPTAALTLICLSEGGEVAKVIEKGMPPAAKGDAVPGAG